MNFSSYRSTAQMFVYTLPVALLAITFLQASIDKLVDRQGNLSYFKTKFAKSFLAKATEPAFWAITALELAAGVLCTLGFLQILLGEKRVIAFWGAAVSAIAVCALFFGLRISKDYDGAAKLVPYFLVAVVAMYVL